MLPITSSSSPLYVRNLIEDGWRADRSWGHVEWYVCSLITLTAAPVSSSIVISIPSTVTETSIGLARWEFTGNRVYACCSLDDSNCSFHFQVRASAAAVFRHYRTDRSLRAAHSGQMTSLLTRVTNGVLEATISRCVLPSTSIARGFHPLSCVCACSCSSRRSSFGRHSVYCRHRGLSLPLAFMSALSMAWARFWAFCSSGSASNRRWILPLAIPRTNRSRSMSSRDAPNSQNSDSCRSSATNVATVSPGFCVRLWNWNLCTITEGFGV